MTERRHDQGRENGVTLPLWMEGEIPTRAGALPPQVSADVCVVGAGMTGLSVAHALARLGRSVVVLEQGAVGCGDTSRTSAHLSNVLDEGYVALERMHGAKGARLAAESHARAIDHIGDVQAREDIACDFVRVEGFLHLAPGQDVESLREEMHAAERAGLRVEWLDTSAGPAIGAGPCLRFPHQAQFHPRRYLAGLVRAIERLGGRIYTQTHVTKFEGGEPVRVTTASGSEITASALVIATNTPVNDVVVVHTKQAAYRSYVVALAVPRGSVPLALHWDTANPYHYVRVARYETLRDQDVLLVGGADHRTGDEIHPEHRWDELEAWARVRFPMATARVDRWSGQIMEPVDGLSFIGRNPADAKNVYIATGDSGHGLTHAAIAASMITALIHGRSHPCESLYDPRRITLGALARYAKESWVTAKHYADWVRPGDVSSEDEIPEGEGATMLVSGRRLAVYRDQLGRCHRFSASCKHLGGVVHWNAAEKTWDCPCHGARFDREGRVVNGPANEDLDRVDITLPTHVPVLVGR